MPSTRELVDHVPQVGRVAWIGLRPGRREPIEVVEATRAEVGRGLVGDRAADVEPNPSRKRQVTLLQGEHLPAVAALVGLDAVDPADLRRNLVVEGINLRSLGDRPFRVGDAVLEITGECHPCSRMEENLGTGGFQAMRGHGGWNARVLEAGDVHVGSKVEALPRPDGAPEPPEVD